MIGGSYPVILSRFLHERTVIYQKGEFEHTNATLVKLN